MDDGSPTGQPVPHPPVPPHGDNDDLPRRAGVEAMSSLFSSSKARIKAYLQSVPWLWRAYWRAKQQVKRMVLLRFFVYDIRHSYRSMFWESNLTVRRTLSAEMLFQYHKLEKGLVMPGPRRLFGVEPASRVAELVARWEDCQHPTSDPIYRGALETLHCYADHVERYGLDSSGRILPVLKVFFQSRSARTHELSTPCALPASKLDGGHEPFAAFRQLAESRRSVRGFKTSKIDPEIISRAVSVAQLSPSACNRQPCRLYVVSDADRCKLLLSYQNGNRGFGHTAPHVGILTSDESCFFDASERHEPYIDGGLFAMSLLLAFRAQGIGSCCLNWCVAPANDLAIHALFDIPESERIVMLLAFGYPEEACCVPRSPRRMLSEVLVER